METALNFLKDTDNFEIVLYIIFGIIVVSLLLMISLIIQAVKLKRLKKLYHKFMQGATGTSLEAVINKQIDELHDFKKGLTKTNKEVADLRSIQLKTVQKLGVVKYNAFKEMGGDLSFVLTMLDEKNNGVMMNAMHTREGCYTYLKNVNEGKITQQTSEEEKKSLEKAMNL